MVRSSPSAINEQSSHKVSHFYQLMHLLPPFLSLFCSASCIILAHVQPFVILA
ncbi:unnamed protein product [Periconia digitata]|uniref:Uncharacterized protein n=1 Tax=Periconia digitata TaxID=1303443 RepID=A0A9W4UG53_9PLEO|nr:unnamed protein product [Periconia digitata]